LCYAEPLGRKCETDYTTGAVEADAVFHSAGIDREKGVRPSLYSTGTIQLQPLDAGAESTHSPYREWLAGDVIGLMLEVDVEFSDYGSVLELARGRFGDFSPTGPSMVTRRSNCKLIGPS